jgi:serine/threonine protein kinase
MTNYYDVLEVSRRASGDVILAAYIALAKRFHDDGRFMRRINEAKEVLLNEDKKALYDEELIGLKKTTLGNYRVIDKIAEGGFGTTYRGEHVDLKEPVCIKHAHELSPEDDELLLQEAKSIWDLRHYAIPAVRDLVRTEDGSFALVMSYVPGPTLAQIIEKKKKLDPEHVAWISERILNALKYLHFNGVVHGDIKPQNIIIQPDKHSVVIVDYGLSLIKPSKKTKNKGYTPLFAPPEQISGEVLLPESDLFSLGATMIYALGGDVEARQVPSYVPNSLCAFIKKFIVRDISARPHWQKEDLCDTLKAVREKEFGRAYSNMKPLKV